MIIRDPGEKGENFKAVIFAIKIYLSMQNLTANSMVLFSYFFLHALVKERMYKNYL